MTATIPPPSSDRNPYLYTRLRAYLHNHHVARIMKRIITRSGRQEIVVRTVIPWRRLAYYAAGLQRRDAYLTHSRRDGRLGTVWRLRTR